MDKLGPRPARADRRSQLSGPRRAVLDLLVERQEPLTVTAVATMLDQHPNTVREHLEALARAGLARRDHLPPAGRGRPASVYTYAPEASFSSPEYAVLARVLVTYLTEVLPDGPVLRTHAREAGRSWGRAIVERDRGLDAAPTAAPTGARGRRDAVERLGTMLDRSGFEARTRHDGVRSTIRLGRCPVLELARERPDVVCNAHLGMAREILGRSDVDPGQVVLEAFVEPGACLLHVASQARADVASGDGGLRIGPA